MCGLLLHKRAPPPSFSGQRQFLVGWPPPHSPLAFRKVAQESDHGRIPQLHAPRHSVSGLRRMCSVRGRLRICCGGLRRAAPRVALLGRLDRQREVSISRSLEGSTRFRSGAPSRYPARQSAKPYGLPPPVERRTALCVRRDRSPRTDVALRRVLAVVDPWADAMGLQPRPCPSPSRLHRRRWTRATEGAKPAPHAFPPRQGQGRSRHADHSLSRKAPAARSLGLRKARGPTTVVARAEGYLISTRTQVSSVMTTV